MTDIAPTNAPMTNERLDELKTAQHNADAGSQFPPSVMLDRGWRLAYAQDMHEAIAEIERLQERETKHD